MRTILILAIFAIGISFNAKSEEKAAPEKAAPEKTKKVEVKNEKVFEVPEKYQKLMELKTDKLSKDDKGLIQVPNSSIQKLKDKTIVLLSLGDNKFAYRFIEVDKKTEKFSLVKKNLLENEVVVTQGSDKLKAGLERMIAAEQHKGHGPSCNH